MLHQKGDGLLPCLKNEAHDRANEAGKKERCFLPVCWRPFTMFLPDDFREFVTAPMTMPILTLVASTKAVRVKSCFYFGGARSEGFATLRNVSKLKFWDKIGHARSVGFWFYSAIWRSESRISSRYLEITLISLLHSLTYSRKKELLFWLSQGLNRLTSASFPVVLGQWSCDPRYFEIWNMH